MPGELWQSSFQWGREVIGTAEVQTITPVGTPSSGTFTLTYNGQTTAAIATTWSAALVQIALRALPNVGGTLITCAGGPLAPGTPITVTFSGSLLGPQSLITSNITSLAGVTSLGIVRTTPGTSLQGTAVAATRKAYFNMDGKLSRTRASRPHAFMVGRRDNVLSVTSGPVQAGGTVNFPISASEIIEPLSISMRGQVVPTSLAAGTAAVQTLTQGNTPTGGTFILSYLGQSTAAIAFGATAAAVGTALNLVPSITAAGGVGVPTGGPFNTTPVVITFTTVGPQPLIVGNGALLTGAGAQPTATVTSTTPGLYSANLWTFTPGTQIDSATIPWYDGARGWNGTGMRGGSLKITGDVNTATTVSLTLAGQNLLAGGLTGGLSDRVPDFHEGWETRIAIDNLGTPPGTTNVAGTLLSWDISMDNAIDWKYTADNTLAANAILLGALTCTAKFKLEAAPQAALTEFNNWDNAGTENPITRMIRLTFGNNTILTGAFTTFVTVDLPGSWTMVDLGQTEGATRCYEFSYSYIYSPNDLFGVQIRCQNGRTAAFA